MFQLARDRAPDGAADLLFCLTDLPLHLRSSVEPAVAEASVAHGVAVISLPALGGIRTHPRARDVLTFLVGQMAAVHLQVGDQGVWGTAPVRRRTARLATPIRHTTSTEADMDTSLTIPGLRGKARLLAGMVRDNRPWRLVPSLSDAFGAAVAAASFGLFFSTIWTLADAMPSWRLLLVNILSLAVLVGWLVIDNGLWERPFRRHREDIVLYNTATLLTLGIGAVCGYAILFTIMFAGAAVVIPGDYLRSTLGHPIGVADYATLAWLAASMGTVAGALGATLEGASAVRAATFSDREQRRRDQQRRRQREADQNS